MPDVQMFPVTSENLAAVGYDSESLKLYVRFNSGDLYEYYRVPEQVYLDLLAFDEGDHLSVGQYFEAAVKKAGYRYRRVG